MKAWPSHICTNDEGIKFMTGEEDLLSHFLLNNAAVNTSASSEPSVEVSSSLKATRMSDSSVGLLPTATDEFCRKDGPCLPKTQSVLEKTQVPRTQEEDVKLSTRSMTRDPRASNLNAKKLKRLESNRESAKLSRRRKKQYLELLEEKVSQLTDEVDVVRREHLSGASSTLHELRNEMIATLQKRLNETPLIEQDDTLDHEIATGIQLLNERFGPNCVERKAVMSYHFDQLKKIVLSPYSRFLLWLSVQENNFFQAEDFKNDQSQLASKKGLWFRLVHELELSEEQLTKIVTGYTSPENIGTRADRRRLAQTSTYLAGLHCSVENFAAAAESQWQHIHSILTPIQSITYLSWMENHRSQLEALDWHQQSSLPPTQDSEEIRLMEILDKPDNELSIEDMSVLLAALSSDQSMVPQEATATAATTTNKSTITPTTTPEKAK